MNDFRLRPARIQIHGEEALPVRASLWDDRVFLECDNIEFFVEHVIRSDAQVSFSQAEGFFVRGVIIPGEGGVFEVMDHSGLVTRPLPVLSAPEAHERIVQRLLWQVQ